MRISLHHASFSISFHSRFISQYTSFRISSYSCFNSHHAPSIISSHPCFISHHAPSSISSHPCFIQFFYLKKPLMSKLNLKDDGDILGTAYCISHGKGSSSLLLVMYLLIVDWVNFSCVFSSYCVGHCWCR